MNILNIARKRFGEEAKQLHFTNLRESHISSDFKLKVLLFLNSGWASRDLLFLPRL